jgi:hypothetical protein
VLDRLGHGRRRVVVYQDLLDLLPARLECEPEAEPLPGALVEAVTDERAARERDLVNSPFLSGSALAGQVAYRFDEFRVAPETDTDRTIESRRRLLSLFDVPV